MLRYFNGLRMCTSSQDMAELLEDDSEVVNSSSCSRIAVRTLSSSSRGSEMATSSWLILGGRNQKTIHQIAVANNLPKNHSFQMAVAFVVAESSTKPDHLPQTS